MFDAMVESAQFLFARQNAAQPEIFGVEIGVRDSSDWSFAIFDYAHFNEKVYFRASHFASVKHIGLMLRAISQLPAQDSLCRGGLMNTLTIPNVNVEYAQALNLAGDTGHWTHCETIIRLPDSNMHPAKADQPVQWIGWGVMNSPVHL